ncbi:MAG: hypothetical protein R3Y28_06045 [Candidatus Gastranaerophilales bacterium]
MAKAETQTKLTVAFISPSQDNDSQVDGTCLEDFMVELLRVYDRLINHSSEAESWMQSDGKFSNENNDLYFND